MLTNSQSMVWRLAWQIMLWHIVLACCWPAAFWIGLVWTKFTKAKSRWLEMHTMWKALIVNLVPSPVTSMQDLPRLLLRIVRISVYYGSSDQFSFHKILNLREKNATVFLWLIIKVREVLWHHRLWILYLFYNSWNVFLVYSTLEIHSNVVNGKNVGFQNKTSLILCSAVP